MEAGTTMKKKTDMSRPSTTLYIASSIDGYIARSDGGLDWLDVFAGSGEDYGYDDFYSGMDALVMGSGTYHAIRGFGEWPYLGRRTVVMTSRPPDADPPDDAVSADSSSPEKVLASLGSEGYRAIWLVGGGKLTASFMARGLVDDIILFVMPVFIGDGIPLFPARGDCLDIFDTLAVDDWPSGVVRVQYRRREP